LEARRAAALVAVATSTVGLVACGSGERQDENEEAGDYRVEVVDASFPQKQSLARKSSLVIKVRNADRKTVPNIAVTVDGFTVRERNASLSDPNRPQFAINGEPVSIGGFPEAKEAGPRGGETAYVGTWALGPLKAGQEKTFRWTVTAVKAGAYRIKYEVSAGLDGKAKAVDSAGTRPSGLFVGTVSDKPPQTRIAEDGKTVVE
jgi:hypothetical protein